MRFETIKRSVKTVGKVREMSGIGAGYIATLFEEIVERMVVRKELIFMDETMNKIKARKRKE